MQGELNPQHSDCSLALPLSYASLAKVFAGADIQKA